MNNVEISVSVSASEVKQGEDSKYEDHTTIHLEGRDDDRIQLQIGYNREVILVNPKDLARAVALFIE